MTDFNEKEFYKKYSGKVTCAFKENIYLDSNGKERCGAKRTQEREKYLFKELNDNVVLIECPKDILAIEFETHDSTGTKNVTKEKLKEFVKKTADNCKKHKLDYTICSHGGTSDYIYICNIENLIEGREKECKKEIAKKVIPKEALPFLDLSNLGNTLIPIINRPHWKFKKYNGSTHKIIDGKNPDKHKNKILDVVLQKLIYKQRPEVKKLNYEHEEDINFIRLTDVISTSGLKKRGNEYQGSNPWHGSETGMNFALNTSKNVWYCFRCGVGGSVAHAIGLNHGIIHSCSDKINSNQFKEILKIAVDNYGLKIRLEKNEEDPSLKKVIANYSGKIDLAKKMWGVQPYFYDSSKLWWIWNKKKYKWEIKDNKDILNIVSANSHANTVNSKEKNEIVEAMSQYGRKKIPKPIQKDWIQFKDKIIDFKTGEEFKASPEYFVTNPIPWELHKDKFVETPIMDRIFEEWVGEKYVKTLYEILSYCLVPNYPIHRLFCFIGEGMNGKSAFLRLLKKFVGEENVTSTELDNLLNSRFEITKLHKKLVCIMGETNFAEMTKTSIIKKLTGQDTIGFEYKNKNPFDDVNYAKILIATNNLPSTTDKTIGFYRRWMIIDFPNRFSEEKDIIEDIPDEEYNILSRKSLTILKDLFEKKSFHNEGSIEDRERKFEEKSDPLEKFIKEFIDIDSPEESIPKWQFERRLNEWLRENRHRAMSDRTIAKRMKEKGIDNGRVYVEWEENGFAKKKQMRSWLGIQWVK